jgi:cyclase
MLTKRIIPCLDVADGRVVKGVRFQGLRDAGDPAERAALYEAQGADEIVILDVAATPEGRGHQHETVRRVRAALLEAGADKVSVNTAAVDRPELLAEISQRFGAQCCVLAIDARQNGETFEVLVKGGREGTGRDALAWAEQAQALGVGEILLTSWDRDGTRSGYDLALTGAVAARLHVPVIASGGANSAEHIREAFEAGADAVLAASIFHDGDTTVGDVKTYLADKDVVVRR